MTNAILIFSALSLLIDFRRERWEINPRKSNIIPINQVLHFWQSDQSLRRGKFNLLIYINLHKLFDRQFSANTSIRLITELPLNRPHRSFRDEKRDTFEPFIVSKLSFVAKERTRENS